MKKTTALIITIMSLFLFSGCGEDYTPPPGEVVLEDFSDLQCPACKAAHPIIEKIKERYGDEITVRFVHFPLEQIHPNAFHAAEAAECARDQGDEAFWEFVTKAYENQDALTDETFKKIASELELEAEAFEKCLTSGDKASIVKDNQSEGFDRNVAGTPTFFLNGEKLEERKYEAIVLKIDALLEETSSE